MTIKKSPSSEQVSKSTTVSAQKRRLNTMCFRCAEVFPKQQGNFTKTRGSFYEQNDGYLHVCNNCLNHLFEHYRNVYAGNTKQACYTLCLNFNLYYSNDIYELATKSPNFDDNPFTAYIHRANGSQFRKWTDFTDTIDQMVICSPKREVFEGGIV